MTPQELAKRITPACAGKTFRFAHEVVEKMDHPRMRGEDRNAYEYAFVVAGSPPHARGRRVFLH